MFTSFHLRFFLSSVCVVATCGLIKLAVRQQLFSYVVMY